MSSGLIIVVAISTAAAVILLVLLLTKVAHALAESASELASDLSRVRGGLRGRSTRARSSGRPVREEAARPADGDSTSSAGREGSSPAGEERAVTAVEKLLGPSGDAPTVSVARKPLLFAREEPQDEPAQTMVAADVLAGRTVDVKQFRRSNEQSEQPIGEDAQLVPATDGSAEGGTDTYRQVGEEVTAVLTAAEHVAAQIREAAVQEAEQTRLAAEEQAAATLAEAEVRRTDADSYSEVTRAAADAYAEETRRSTDEAVAKTVSEAEEQARVIRAEAERKAGEIEAEAARRRDDLTTKTEGMQKEVESMLHAFRGMTAELEDLVPAERRSGGEEPEPPADELLDEALRPTSPHGDLSSHADS
jgi:hypothetical protein